MQGAFTSLIKKVYDLMNFSSTQSNPSIKFEVHPRDTIRQKYYIFYIHTHRLYFQKQVLPSIKMKKEVSLKSEEAHGLQLFFNNKYPMILEQKGTKKNKNKTKQLQCLPRGVIETPSLP